MGVAMIGVGVAMMCKQDRMEWDMVDIRVGFGMEDIAESKWRC